MSNFNPIIISLTIIAGFLVILLPKKFAIVPMILTALYITIGQKIDLFTLDFNMLRILMFFGVVRIIFREGISSITLNPLDKTILWWLAITIINFTLLYQTSNALINRLGLAYDVMGSYFYFRFLIKDIDDFNRTFKIIAIVIVPLAAIMLYEYNSGKNIFAVFGGVPESSELRNGIPRCQGPFRHPILAGTFGATLVPIFVSLWWQNKNGKIIASIGTIPALIIVATSNSSGPFMALLFAILGLSMWYLRHHMRAVRWGLFLSLFTLHFYMKAPVWYVIARISEIIGGTGWHRSYLIEQAIKYFNDWWLIGTKITVHWMPYGLAIDPDSSDITNQFIGEGVTGGIVKMLLFILILVRCYQGLGNRLRFTNDLEFSTKIIFWAMGSALLAHIVSFFSVGYFDQIKIFWYLLLASIAAVSFFPRSSEFIENKQIPVK